jgi:endogenous inhibitor of DNA gyrase (YacG/DUF329 family)
MAESPPRLSRCALCGKPQDQAYRPFCSKRCADIDLNRWLSGAYAIKAEEEDLPKGDDEGA